MIERSLVRGIATASLATVGDTIVAMGLSYFREPGNRARFQERGVNGDLK